MQSVKSPLTPLFQRGERKTGVLRIADLRIFYLVSIFRSPPLEKGIKGDLSDASVR